MVLYGSLTRTKIKFEHYRFMILKNLHHYGRVGRWLSYKGYLPSLRNHDSYVSVEPLEQVLDIRGIGYRGCEYCCRIVQASDRPYAARFWCTDYTGAPEFPGFIILCEGCVRAGYPEDILEALQTSLRYDTLESYSQNSTMFMPVRKYLVVAVPPAGRVEGTLELMFMVKLDD